MKTSSIITIAVVIILLVVGIYFLYSQKTTTTYGSDNNQPGSQLDKISESEFENIQTEDEVLTEIDNTINLLE